MNKLSTFDRIWTWNMQINPHCVFYQNDLKSGDHLFFIYSFLLSIWDHILLFNDVQSKCQDLNFKFHWSMFKCKGTFYSFSFILACFYLFHLKLFSSCIPSPKRKLSQVSNSLLGVAF